MKVRTFIGKKFPPQVPLAKLMAWKGEPTRTKASTLCRLKAYAHATGDNTVAAARLREHLQGRKRSPLMHHMQIIKINWVLFVGVADVKIQKSVSSNAFANAVVSLENDITLARLFAG